jgi:hypothetical protein
VRAGVGGRQSSRRDGWPAQQQHPRREQQAGDAECDPPGEWQDGAEDPEHGDHPEAARCRQRLADRFPQRVGEGQRERQRGEERREHAAAAQQVHQGEGEQRGGTPSSGT